MTNREFFAKVNEIAKTNPDRAKGWLDCYNRDHGTKYYIDKITHKAVFDRIDHGVMNVLDAYTWASNDSIF